MQPTKFELTINLKYANNPWHLDFSDPSRSRQRSS